MKRELALWTGVLGGPVIWLSSFEARFAWAPWACTFQDKIPLYVVTLTAMLLCACCATIAWTQWKALGERGPSGESGSVPRSTFMAIGGMILSAGCFLIVLAQAIPELILGACE